MHVLALRKRKTYYIGSPMPFRIRDAHVTLTENPQLMAGKAIPVLLFPQDREIQPGNMIESLSEWAVRTQIECVDE